MTLCNASSTLGSDRTCTCACVLVRVFFYCHSLYTLSRHLLESLQCLLPSSLQKINKNIHQTFLCVHEASQNSPSWTAYLQQIDSTLLSGLKHLLLTVLATLVQKATRYEQGAPILPLVMVQLELQGGDIQFSPPLSGHSAVRSVPEVVQKWMNDYLGLTKLIPRCVYTVRTCTCMSTCYNVMCMYMSVASLCMPNSFLYATLTAVFTILVHVYAMEVCHIDII